MTNNYIVYQGRVSFFDDQVTFPTIPVGAAVWRRFAGLPEHVPVIRGDFDDTPLHNFDTNED